MKSIERRDVEKELGRRVPDYIWDFMVHEPHVSEVKIEGIPWLAEKISRLLPPKAKLKRSRRQRRDTIVSARRRATSWLLAAIARKDEQLKAFRRTFLEGVLLKPEEVETWLQKNVDHKRYRHAVVLSLPMETDSHVLAIQPNCEVPVALLKGNRMENVAPIDVLPYRKVGSDLVFRVPVGRDGSLRFLYQLTKHLATFFNWNPADALMFVLTDRIPPVTLHDVEFRWPPSYQMGSESEGLRPIACLSRVIITVDPLTTPREVSEMYAPMRAKLLKRKPKQLSEKQMYLAGFTAEHDTPDRGIMNAWNDKYSNWKYSRFSLFSRDRRRAREILLTEVVFDYKQTLSSALAPQNKPSPQSRVGVGKPSAKLSQKARR